MDRTVTVLGAGAWGTAIAVHMANNGYRVVLWCFEETVARDIASTRINSTYFPDVRLDEAIEVTTDIAYAIGHSTWIFEAIPTAFLRATLERIRPLLAAQHVWVVLSKGIEQGTFKLPTQIVDDVLGQQTRKVVFAGPNFAKEIARKALTATSIAGSDHATANQCSLMLASPTFEPWLVDDLIGVQVGGAYKNVLALACGIAQGLGWGENARAYVLTQGLREMATLAEFYGGKRETVYGLSGLGDMLLTCTGTISKNLNAGRLLGSGMTHACLKTTGMILPEGFNTVQSLHQLVARHELDCPIARGVYAFIFQEERSTFLQELWHRVPEAARE